MTQTAHLEDAYAALLNTQLVCALGCTEPISIAYASAKAREQLGCFPETILVECSGNIIKNVKGVVVPNCGGMRGIEAAALIGTVSGKSAKKLQVLEDVLPGQVEEVRSLLGEKICTVKLLDTPHSLHIIVTASAHGHTAAVEILHTHSNIVRISADGETVFSATEQAGGGGALYTEYCSTLNMEGILHFAATVPLEKVQDVLEAQIANNSRISCEGLTHDYGIGVGRMLMQNAQSAELRTRACAAAAAASDARMGGCTLPVVINSGSGNQGITASIPVIEYAKSWGADHETLLRALIISNLTSINIKHQIGLLSAFCGAVSAACGCGAAITYLAGGSAIQISDTVINTLGNVSGIICDGAKASCACKIASAVDAAISSHLLAMENRRFQSGDGIIKEDVDATIKSVGDLARLGMKETDRQILSIMLS